MMKNHIGTIKIIREINDSVFELEIFSNTLKNIEPGEYISILCGNLTLRRPFSVADFDSGMVRVFVKKRGEGTKFLSNLKTGDNVEFSAPLGNTFKLEKKKTLLIGAGIGVAPLFYLNKRLKSIGAETFSAAGFLKNEDIFGTFDFVSTDDGSNSNKGSICDYLDMLFEKFQPEKVVVCAPHKVLEIVAKFAQKKALESEVCMEKVMACGIGVCRGCVIKVKNGDSIENRTVCKDGPVFDGAEVVW